MPTRENLRPVKDKLSAGRVGYDDGVTYIAFTDNVANQLGICMEQNDYDNNKKTIYTYQTIDQLNTMLETIGYKIVTTKYLKSLKTKANKKTKTVKENKK